MKIVENRQKKQEMIIEMNAVFDPEYKKQWLVEYSGNPFIEALPSIFTDDEIINKFTVYPLISEKDKEVPKNVRFHYIGRLKSFSQPLDIHFKVERKLSTIIRRGYLARNPLSKEFKIRFMMTSRAHELIKKKQFVDIDSVYQQLETTAEAFSIIGVSGVGKSVTIERLLHMYPQVIVHKEYNDTALSLTQIVWMKLDTPHDGSLKTLCKHFFKYIDDRLDTEYLRKFGGDKNSKSTMMIHMVHLSSLYGVGVIVIDEMQQLLKSKNSPEEIMHFFVTLINTIGVPIIMIGTPPTKELLERTFSQARRGGSIGSIKWDKMENDDNWKFFVETMWKYQWTDVTTTISEKLIDSLYDHSQGIISLAVIIFMLSQDYILESNVDTISESVFEAVSKNDLDLVQKMIHALKTNNIKEIAKYDDLIIDFEDTFMNEHYNLEHRKKITELNEQNKQKRKLEIGNNIETILAEILDMGIFSDRKKESIKDIIREGIKLGHDFKDKIELKEFVVRKLINNKESSKTKVGRPKNDCLSSSDLRKIHADAIKNKKKVYDSLNDVGIIKEPLKEFHS